MSDPTFRHDDLETRRKRLRFRAWHRGTKEADLLIGPFADAALAAMDHEALDDFETVLRLPDPNLVAWLTGQAELPADLKSPVMLLMMKFQEDRLTN
jgi:antitoxin CptB